MGQTREAITQNLVERWCGEAARRDAARVARWLNRKQRFDGGYPLDEGAVLEAFFHCLAELGVLERIALVRGTALQRTMVLWVQYVRRYGVKPLFGIKSITALPPWLCSAAALWR